MSSVVLPERPEPAAKPCFLALTLRQLLDKSEYVPSMEAAAENPGLLDGLAYELCMIECSTCQLLHLSSILIIRFVDVDP